MDGFFTFGLEVSLKGWSRARTSICSRKSLAATVLKHGKMRFFQRSVRMWSFTSYRTDLISIRLHWCYRPHGHSVVSQEKIRILTPMLQYHLLEGLVTIIEVTQL